jgi:hypothetical protein
LIQGAAENRSHGRKLTRMAIALGGIALIGSALALKGGAPALLKGSSVVAPANDTARAQNPGGDTARTPADISTTPPAGLSGETPVAPEVDAQAVEGPAPKASTHISEPQPAQRVSVRPEGTLIAPQVSSVAERGPAADSPKPPVKPASGRMNAAAGATQPSYNLSAKRPGTIGKTDAAVSSADAPTPPLPIGTPARPEEASGAKALQRIVKSVAASATPAEAPATGSTGWVVQLGASRSEAEARRDLKRLNTKYGSALKGSTVGFRKVLVDGETVYRLHVDGLSRDKAAALCSRVKGDGGSCSMVR